MVILGISFAIQSTMRHLIFNKNFKLDNTGYWGMPAFSENELKKSVPFCENIHVKKSSY
jgi:hypothetical protein